MVAWWFLVLRLWVLDVCVATACLLVTSSGLVLIVYAV